MSKDDQVR